MTPRKIILKNFQAPGDIVMLTAALRDLHHHNPGLVETDVRTSCPDLWINNPHLSSIDEGDSEVSIIKCNYPLIHRANQLPYHFIHGFQQYLSFKLELKVEPTAFRGDIHLSEDERILPEHLKNKIGSEPFWVMVAGGKSDFTIKWWSTERWQAVVDSLRGDVQFVQTGEEGHHHPPLDGVIDLRGKTTTREFVRLIHHAEGVVCPVTFAMHLAAAVPTIDGRPALRPCVVVAGGREPPHWEWYPGHQFLHTMGMLPCCATGGCWRSRTLPLNDNDIKNRPSTRCVDVVDNTLPRCMDMITPEDVVQCVRRFLKYDEGAGSR